MCAYHRERRHHRLVLPANLKAVAASSGTAATAETRLSGDSPRSGRRSENVSPLLAVFIAAPRPSSRVLTTVGDLIGVGGATPAGHGGAFAAASASGRNVEMIARWSLLPRLGIAPVQLCKRRHRRRRRRSSARRSVARQAQASDRIVAALQPDAVHPARRQRSCGVRAIRAASQGEVLVH